VWKELRDLERAGARGTVVRIREVVDRMRSDPFTPRSGFHAEPVEGPAEVRRVRVGRFRVFYEIDEPSRTVRVLRVSRRRVAYRD